MPRAPLVALVAVALAGGAGEARPWGASTAGPPSALADGRPPLQLPTVVRRFEALPVVGARRLVRPSVPSWCDADPRDSRLRGWLSPEGLSIVYRDARSSLPGACDAIRVRSRWARCSVGIGRSIDPRAVERAGGGLGVCSLGGLRHGFMWIVPPARTTWALVARRGFWAAYAAAGMRLIRISGTEGVRGSRFRATVVFLDARGRVVERRRVVGAVAG